MNDIIPLVLGAAAASFLVAAAVHPPKPSREDFWGLPNRTVKRNQLEAPDPRQSVAYGILPTPQSAAADRGLGLRAIASHPITTGGFNAADYPLSFQGAVRENYTAQRPNHFTNCRAINDFQDAAADGYYRASAPGDVPAIYDRLIIANQKSRLSGLGDPIRGDLPIAPINDGWFRPSVAPNIDLRQGAINVIAGADNETSNSLRNLQLQHSAKAGMSNQHLRQGDAVGNVIITTFP